MISVSAGGWLVSAGCGGIFLLSAVGPRCGSWLSAAGVACGARPMGCLYINFLSISFSVYLWL